MILEDRDGSVDISKYLEDAIPFDEFIKEMSYDEISAILNGADDEEDDEEGTPPRKVSRGEPEGAPPAPEKPSPKEDECPEGFPWGDAWEHKECQSCSVRKACGNASKD